MSEHTPGPWVWEEWAARGHYTIRELYAREDAVPRPVATIEPSARDIARASAVIELPLETLEANARLIAAAPELLDLAELVADEGCQDGGNCGECLGCFARAAIAKARGQQP